MGEGDDQKCVFPLTSLQIGDLQSYRSDLNLFLANESKRFYILVDNRPWLGNLGSRPAHLWQLMVTKSRLSPFANSKARKERMVEQKACSEPNIDKTKEIKKWFSLIDSATLSHRSGLLHVNKLRNSLLLSSDLQRILYGFIVFEVSWANIRGINYLNELQTDTSLAIEAKYMKRWEFDSILQAVNCLPSWFSGTSSELLQLKEYLDSVAGDEFYDAEEDFSRNIPIEDDEIIQAGYLSADDCSPHCTTGNFSVYSATVGDGTGVHTPPPPTGPYKRRKVIKFTRSGVELDTYYEERQSETDTLSIDSETSTSTNGAVEAMEYKDVLVVFRFSDRDLPFKLREIIISDLRLLTLLEAGLPSWVIFLQSYPGFCHLYRPWMCLLARALYVLISFVTVLIGFYDLYKNVPVLKATASRICGPLFDWIETWEMVTRIKYLGTMLFLHNIQKAIKWLLAVTHTTRSFFLVFTRPLASPIMTFLGFFLPVWNSCVHAVDNLCSVAWIMIESSCDVVGDVFEIILLPFWYILSLIWTIATSILYPLFLIIWEILYTPIRMLLALGNFLGFAWEFVDELARDIWQTVSGIFKLASASKATVSTCEVSIWRSLWNDLFSQVFRAVRSILNGFVAFFTACNRHRLSIYNHILGFIARAKRSQRRFPRSQHASPKHSRATCWKPNGSETTRKFHVE